MWPFKFPYTNFHELNLDWILETVKSNTGRIAANELKIKLIGGDDPLNALHPIGSIFMSTSDTSPAALFGGTWEQVKDVFLLGAGDNYTVTSVGGEANHTLTVSEMPKHAHGYEVFQSAEDAGFYRPLVWQSSTNEPESTWWSTETGEGIAHNNMPPYYAVNMWKRVA